MHAMSIDRWRLVLDNTNKNKQELTAHYMPQLFSLEAILYFSISIILV